MSGNPASPGQRQPMDPQGPPAPAEELARRLMAHEANGGDAAEDLVAAGERVVQRLREELVRVLGHEGFSALEGRAVSLASRRYRVLGDVASGPRTLADALAALAGRDAVEARAAMQAVCAQLLGLLFTFLGGPLATQFIHLAWPDLPGDDADARERETR